MSASVLGKRGKDSQDIDSEDEWERKFKAPRTDKTPRRIPQPREKRGNGGVVQDETTLIQISDERVDCTDKVVFYYMDPNNLPGDSPNWCSIELDELRHKIWELLTSEELRGDKALKGNFSVDRDVGNINDFMRSTIADPANDKMRKAFLAWLVQEAKFYQIIPEDLEDYTPSNPKAIFFIHLWRNTKQSQLGKYLQEDDPCDDPEDSPLPLSPATSL
jgi:hypothetical protein